MNLSHATIWITGASSGIGEALAYALCEKFPHSTLVLSARRNEELERVKARCVAQHGARSEKIFIQPLDLSQTETLQASVSEVLHNCGHIDLLVNNGGIAQRSLASETTLAVDRRIMEVNFFGTVALTKALLPSMLARKQGHFAVVTSVVGKIGTPYRSAYSASKHALHGFFDSLRAELWQENIQVTLITPGFIKTAISLNALLGDGTALGTMDGAQASGMSAEECARRIIRALERDAEEVAMGGPREMAVLVLKRLAPRVLSRILQTAQVR